MAHTSQELTLAYADLVRAAQAAVQSVGGTNAEATKRAHEEALADLDKALAAIAKAEGRS